MSVTVVAANSCSVLGEGPAWDARSQTLNYVDILKGEVHTYDPSTCRNQKVKVGDYVSYVIPREKGGHVVGNRTKVTSVDLTTGTSTTLVQVTGDQPVQNDAKCDARGRLWTGMLGAAVPECIENESMGSLYSVGLDLKVQQHFGSVRLSNGIAWSTDYKVMYYVDSLKDIVRAFDFDLDSGTINNERVALTFTEAMGSPDGMSTDQDGNLWVACFGAGKVRQFNPITGKELRSVEVPEALQVTSCCFGGHDLQDLYVTTARLETKLDDAESLKLQPLAGSLFKVTGLGVKGMPVASFAG